MASPLPAPPGYTIQTKLGEGGFGTVYKATTLNGEVCALKAVNLSSMSQGSRAAAKKTWENEVGVLVQASNHQNVVTYHKSFSFGDILWLQMEFCAGGSLQSYYYAKGISRSLKRQLMMEVASAIDYLHGKDTIHRDLKPDNVLIQYNGRNEPYAKLADFGLAYAIASANFGGNLDSYYMNTQLGTHYYMAPEIYQSRYTFKADIFAMGILYMTFIRETSVDVGLSQRYLTNCAVDTNGKVWSCGEYMNTTKAQLALNSNAVVGDGLRNLVNDMILLDYRKRPTANEVYARLQSSISAGDFDENPKSRPSCTVKPPN